uniref:Transmembrane protein n=1 Tax=Chromera velia CCMP2878 TaxID=1169474 RepID=A0A0G4IFT7_9ALVE|eukprot:Cvel_2469.t1-p1 / transcript=Cvel_2469.t1 / gene=Cvel_2469 / organism=Chromera_velia_CCMP2878 / gene_product=hypothetical protein / transcript_product=hypothetical protein / location=Cvel_scaffold97:57290-60015(-) / protein_length=757 / sequence_SO=supercontig / SO=protein_coding / is_pseudo=false
MTSLSSLSQDEVSKVLRDSRLPSALSRKKRGRRELYPSGAKYNFSQPLSPLRLLEAQSQEVEQQTLRQLLAHPRPIPFKDFSLVQRWPRAVVVSCPFDGTCTSADRDGNVQVHFQNETAGTVCVEGYVGPLCSECGKGQMLLREGTKIRCRDCPDTSRTFVAGIGLFLLTVCVVLFYVNLVTKDNPKLDVPESAITFKILTVFLTALGFLAELARSTFVVFREQLSEEGSSARLGGVGQHVASIAQEFLGLLQSMPTVGEIFSMKCLFDLFEWTTGKHVADRELFSLLVPVGVICLIGLIGLVVVLSSYWGDAGGEEEKEEEGDGKKRTNNREQTDPNSATLPPTRSNTKGQGPPAVTPATLLTGGDRRDSQNVEKGVAESRDSQNVEKGVAESRERTGCPPVEAVQSAWRQSSSCTSKSFVQVCKRFCNWLAFNRRFLGIFRYSFDEETSIWMRLLCFLEDMTPVVLCTLFLWAPSLVSAPLASLRCKPLHPNLKKRRLHRFPSVVCDEKDPRYTRWQSLSFGVLLAGVFGVPFLASSAVLFENWRVSEERQGHGPSAAPVGEGGGEKGAGQTAEKEGGAKGKSSRGLSGPRARGEGSAAILGTSFRELVSESVRANLALFSRKFSVLLTGYSDKFLYWELVVFARRLSIPISLLAQNPSARYTLLTFHSVFFIVLQTTLRPYRSAALNWLETFSLYSWFFEVMVLKISSEKETGGRRGECNDVVLTPCVREAVVEAGGGGGLCVGGGDVRMLPLL